MGAVIGRFRPECQVRMQREINNYAGVLQSLGSQKNPVSAPGFLSAFPDERYITAPTGVL